MFIRYTNVEFISQVPRRSTRLERILIFTGIGIDPDGTVGRFDLRDRIAVTIDAEAVAQFRPVIGI